MKLSKTLAFIYGLVILGIGVFLAFVAFTQVVGFWGWIGIIVYAIVASEILSSIIKAISEAEMEEMIANIDNLKISSLQDVRK